jgi:predicted Zn-dependent protease
MYVGDFALTRKDLAGAERNYLAVLKIQPDAAAALNNLAWLTHQAHKPGSLAYAERANAVAPNEPAFMDTWAMLLADKGDYAKAIDLQRKAVERQPSNGTYRLNLAKIYIAAGDRPRAKTELDSLARLGGKDPSSQEANALLKTL